MIHAPKICVAAVAGLLLAAKPVLGWAADQVYWAA